MPIQAKCPAKLNLFLKIIGKRSDNYHALQSLFVKINLYDEIEVEKSDNFKITIEGGFSSSLDVANNIFCDIFSFFKERYKLDSNVNIFLKKNIPIGAGLGGGSSDGAYFIKILNELFALKLSKTAMQEISLNFGSDLPFFFEEKMCFVEGRGEIISKIHNSDHSIDKLNQHKILLIFPQIHLSTADIFKTFNTQINQSSQQYSAKIKSDYFLQNDLINIICNNGNDLEPSAMMVSSIVKNIKDDLEKFSPLCAKMTGSGSAFFAIFSDAENYKKCLDFFSENHPQFFVQKDVVVI